MTSNNEEVSKLKQAMLNLSKLQQDDVTQLTDNIQQLQS